MNVNYCERSPRTSSKDAGEIVVGGERIFIVARATAKADGENVG